MNFFKRFASWLRKKRCPNAKQVGRYEVHYCSKCCDHLGDHQFDRKEPVQMTAQEQRAPRGRKGFAL